MRSVADELKQQQQRELMAMTPAARIEMAIALSNEGLDFFAATHGISLEEARRRIRKQRRAGRTPSRCMEDE